MADVLLLSASRGEFRCGPIGPFARAAARDRFGVHRLTDDPARADLILFVVGASVDPLLRQVRRHPYFRRYPGKSFVHCGRDVVVPTLRGLYPALERRHHDPVWARGSHYFRHLDKLADLSWDADDTPRRWLGSFVGAVANAPVRARLMQLDHPELLLVDSAARRPPRGASPAARAAFWETYVQEIRDSAFVLCPRGLGPATLRVFEAMALARCPVILADDWTPPDGPDWRRFALILPESEVARVPALLERERPRAATLGRRARAAWEAWFSPEVSFHRTVEACLQMQRAGRLARGLAKASAWTCLLSEPHRTGFVWDTLAERRLLGRARRLKAALRGVLPGGRRGG